MDATGSGKSRIVEACPYPLDEAAAVLREALNIQTCYTMPCARLALSVCPNSINRRLEKRDQKLERELEHDIEKQKTKDVMLANEKLIAIREQADHDFPYRHNMMIKRGREHMRRNAWEEKFNQWWAEDAFNSGNLEYLFQYSRWRVESVAEVGERRAAAARKLKSMYGELCERLWI